MGSRGEFDHGLSVRWKATGGDSVVRFRNATESLTEWQEVMRRCTFHTLNAFDFLAECLKRDTEEAGIYCDPPWPDDGDVYNHKFPEAAQRRLALTLGNFQRAKIIVRYGDHPLIRELYPEAHWTWHKMQGRTQANGSKEEALIVRNRG